ncbi:MAG: T9SS type A sorting domain-containing protein [bacterium]|nr:T9SS type A sorting domain-containing protein [bacterium]
MKRQLLSIIAALTVGTAMAQVPSTSWATNQNAVFAASSSVATNPGVKFMDAVDANVVWVIGTDWGAPSRNYNWYSRTINGGTSFAGGNVFSDTNTYNIANMEGIDANTAWVCSYMKATSNQGAIHRTTNGGASWNNMTATGMYTSTTAFANWVTFLTPSVGIANGDPVNGEYELWRTTDGGLSWAQVPGTNIPNPNSGEFAIVNLYAKVGTSNVWFGTNGNRMFRTTDAGVTWSVSTVGIPSNTITEIAFSSPLNGVCYTGNGTALELWNSSNGGATWTQITPLPANLGLWDVTGIPGTGNLASYGAGTGNTIISYSSDNGLTWTDWGSTGIPYITGDFVNGSTAWAGSLSFSTFTNIWKYTGATITGTVAPTAAFSLPANLCLTGPTATVVPANTSTGSPVPTYSWSSTPAGAVFSNPTAATPTITFSSGNTYTITLVATNAGGSNSSSQVITVAACVAPIATFTLPASGCANYSFTAVNTSTGAPTPAYFWSVAPATGVTVSPSSIATSPVIKVTSVGVYTITLVASNASGTAAATQTINVAPCPPTATFSIPANIRFCDVKTFSTTNSTSNPAGMSGSITYTWSVTPNTGVSVFPNYFQQNLSVTISNSTIPQYTVTLRAKNASGTSTVAQTISVNDCNDVGVNELSLNNLLGVYPNPVKDQLNLSLPNTGQEYGIKITNVLGSVIYQEASSKENITISIGNNPRGIYFLTVESKTEKVTRKIVLE